MAYKNSTGGSGQNSNKIVAPSLSELLVFLFMTVLYCFGLGDIGTPYLHFLNQESKLSNLACKTSQPVWRKPSQKKTSCSQSLTKWHDSKHPH